MSRLYHLPSGLLHGKNAGEAVDAGKALWLAGGPMAFQDVVLMERGGAAQVVPVSDWTSHFSRQAADLSDKRPPFAGISLSDPVIMGILNVTPDSFSDGGDLTTLNRMKAEATSMIDHGAQILDVGGESTRPGSDTVPIDSELDRVLPAIRILTEIDRAPVSIDSRKPEVFEKAVVEGAAIINDVSALTYSERSLPVAAATGAPVILMHAQGDPKTMQDEPRYENVLLDVYDWLEERITACEAEGINRSQIVIDPGIGFGKTLEHNLALLGGLALFHGLGCPVLLGVSRKSFIHKIVPSAEPKGRIGGSLAAVVAGRQRGAQIFRVHDVRETVETLAVSSAIEHA